jgi:hypothetical protein
MSQGRDLGLLLRHEPHQDSPYGQQTKGHSNNSGIGANRAVSCLDRARMTKAAYRAVKWFTARGVFSAALAVSG